MQMKPKAQCPINKFEPCKQLECAWFIEVRGIKPNTGEEVSEWGCSVAWLPHLLIENAAQSRATGAAVESFRNEMVEANKATVSILGPRTVLLKGGAA